MMKLLIPLIGWLGLFGLQGESAVVTPTAPQADYYQYLPVVIAPFVGGSGEILNGSFEEPWTNLPPAPGFLINQQPQDWTLTWIQPGQPLYDSGDLSGGVPECIHKLADQLPPNEQPGGPDALVLEGQATYKIFHFGAPFGAELKQTLTGLTPGSRMELIVPMQVHLHGETDPFATETRVQVNGVGGWVNGATMGDRDWYYHSVIFVVPANGTAEIVLQVKSKWPSPKDFFMDDIRLVPAP